MKLLSTRRAGVALAMAAGAVTLVTLAASPAMASPLFCGAGYGLTRDVAIQSALEDAQISAQSEGFYGLCTMVDGTLFVGQVSNPLFGTRITASLSVTCEHQ